MDEEILGKNKLQSWGLGPLEVVDDLPETLTILREVLLEGISKDRAMKYPYPETPLVRGKVSVQKRLSENKEVRTVIGTLDEFDSSKNLFQALWYG